MPPVLEQTAPPPLAPGGLFQQPLFVRTETGKQRQIVRTHQRIDRVDLQHPETLDQPGDMGQLDGARATPGKALGDQRQTTCLAQGQAQGHRIATRTDRPISRCLFDTQGFSML